MSIAAPDTPRFVSRLLLLPAYYPAMPRILIVEDEEKVGTSLRQGLLEAGFAADLARRGDEGLLYARSGTYDLVLLDIMLPKRDGWDVLRELRADGSRTPVICLTARDEVRDRVRGLDLGADDYIVKPFAFSELLARVRTVLRRVGGEGPGRLVVADLELDLLRRRVTRRGKDVALTPRECSLLALLMKRRGEVLTRSMIAREVWDMRLDGHANVVDVAVRRLRAKVDEPFTKPLIHTVRGLGYVLEDR